jgi:hypothetical protein
MIFTSQRFHSAVPARREHAQRAETAKLSLPKHGSE